MRYFSAFSGIGSPERAIQELGFDHWSCVGYSEIDKYAIQTYEKNFEHQNLGDITKIDEKTMPYFDVFIGGFPCQAFSVAGQQLGFEDTRGTLFFDCARIIKHRRPEYFILENVKGLLSHEEGRTFRTIINALWEIGYAVDYEVLNSCNFGVPQNRERVFIVGKRKDLVKETIPDFWHFPFIHSTDKSKVMTDILEDDVDESLYLTDEQVEKILTNSYGMERDRIAADYGLCGCLTATDARRPKCVEITRNQSQGQRIYKPVLSVTLSAEGGGMGAKTGLYEIGGRVRRLTLVECERLQGFPDNWTEGVSNAQRYKQCGNSITVNVIKNIIKAIDEDYKFC